MAYQLIKPAPDLTPFVRNIWVFSETGDDVQTSLPFFADGFPGILFHNAGSRFTIVPHTKVMKPVFIYGQTLQPIEIQVKGSFTIVVFQIYPFVLKSLFGVDPKSIVDACYDIPDMEAAIAREVNTELSEFRCVIESITSGLLARIKSRQLGFDPVVKKVIEQILATQGQVRLHTLAEQLWVNERTLERRFRSETALSPKQFAKIIQFQNSLTQLSVRDFETLSDIVYKNGYADQSHFIRVFKSFTGKTPRAFVKV